MSQEFLNTELKPYSELTREEKHCLLDAFLDNCLQYYSQLTCVWHDKYESEMGNSYIYRTKPKEYKKLDIPWQVIDEKWKWAAMDCTGETYFFSKSPDRFTGEVWQTGFNSFCKSPLKLDTTGIVAEHSLTQRPE